MCFFLEYNIPEIFVISGTLVLLVILLAEAFEWTTFFGPVETGEKNSLAYGYGDCNGPHCWKEYFPNSCGDLQSPINLVTRTALVINPCASLKWSSTYLESPDYLQLCNDGNCVILLPRWCDCALPTIAGGPLDHTYELDNLKFRWGPTDYEGSEHTIDHERFAMELQVFYVSADQGSFCEGGCDKSDVVIVSYLFKTTMLDNPYLDQIITKLCQIRHPKTVCYMKPFPLNWIAPVFETNYFTYQGSLSYPPCTEGATWIVQPEPLMISNRQINKFRKLLGNDGLLISNTRPVQLINNRDIFFYE